MKDLVPKGTGNSRYLKSVSNFLSLYPDYRSFTAALIAGTLPIDLNGLNAAGIQQQGTALNTENLLSGETASLIQSVYGSGDVPETPNAALATLAGAIGLRSHIAYGSYTGTGVYGSENPNSITFEFAPNLVIVARNGVIDLSAQSGSPGFDNGFFAMRPGAKTTGVVYSYTKYDVFFTWADKTLSWYGEKNAGGQLNAQGYAYYYIAIG